MAKTPGYSGTPLATKLGLKEGHSLLAWGAPEEFEAWLEPLPPAASVARVSRVGKSPCQVALVFVTRAKELERSFAAAKARLTDSGGLWVCWPKKSSGVESELTEDVIRAFGLETGMVDNKVCAVSEVWSGLRFVVRLNDRPAREVSRSVKRNQKG